MAIGLSSGQRRATPSLVFVDVAGRRGAGRSSGVASLIMRGLVTPWRFFVAGVRSSTRNGRSGRVVRCS